MEGKILSDRYEITSELGRGGMGVVYPAIVPIHDFGRHEGSLFFVMPVIEGTSLREVMREGTLTLGQVISIGIQVAEALEYSHGRGVVHRDIKPENMMITSEGGSVRVRVMDFGLARSTNVTQLTRTGMLMGTMAYVSPEQVSGAVVDGRADLYSLGTVLYECVTNDVPFSGELQSILYRVVHEAPQPPSSRGAEIDEELERAILRCMEKDPGKRMQNAAELAQALKAYQSGIRDSQQMQSVIATRAVPMPRQGLAPFVGREDELKQLQQRLNLAIEGKCQFVTISGEAGAGKTRLLDELENLAHARQLRLLHGRFVEQEAAFPYYGFCEAIQEYFQQKELGSTSSGLPDLSDIAADLVALFPMLGEIEPIRTAAAGGSQMLQAGGALAAENRTEIFELLARTLTRLAGGKPLILILEELHGAQASIEALQYIVRRLAATPTLVIGTYRSTEIDKRHPMTKMLAAFRGDRQSTSISLGPFSSTEHRSFLQTLIGGNEIVDHLAEQLYETSEGNPFFTKELVRSLLDSGNIVQNDTGAWTLSGGMQISSDALPATIQQAVEERVERLPDDLKEILSIASVMGRSFAFRDLETLTQDEGDPDKAVDRLVQEGLIEEVRQSRDDRLTFTSGVVREVLYAGLSRRRRRSLHRKYANQLERRNAGRLERVYPQLAHHFAEGDEPEKAVEYGLLQAKRSLDALSPEEVIRATKTALEFLDREWEGERSVEGDARMLLAAGQAMAGEIGHALKEIEAGVRIFEREGLSDRSVGARLDAARMAWQARQPEEASRWVDEGMQAARVANEESALADFLSLAATLASFRGEHDKAKEYLAEAGRLRPEGDAEEQEVIPQGGKLTVALANPVTATKPSESHYVEEREVFANGFETLLGTDEAGNLVPVLCDKWHTPDGGRSFVLTLRKGVRFHDGHPMAAEDVRRSLMQTARDASQIAALSPIEGLTEFVDGRADEVAGLIPRAEHELEIRLTEPIPIFPVFLTHQTAAITRDANGDGRSVVGTGAFRVVSHDADCVVLERHPEYWKGTPARLDTIEFRTNLNASAIASGFREGNFDLGRDLQPEDMEQILRDPRLRRGLVEVPRKTTYFVLFNSLTGPVAKSEALRRALSGVVVSHDLIWKTVGRFGQPAASFLPPGILGHDPGRRRPSLSREQALEILRAADVPEAVELQAAVHPLIGDRYAALLQELFAAWAELGVRASIRNLDPESFSAARRDNAGIDLYISRWNADYDDPDNFTHTLFRSETGDYCRYFSSPEADEILEQGRAEGRPEARVSLYRKFENLLLDSGTLIPLFYDVDYRVAGPKVRGLKLGNSAPFVNYAEMGKAETAEALPDAHPQGAGILQIPMTAVVSDLSPVLSATVDQAEVVQSIYETLTRDVGEGRIEPWLAEDLEVRQGGKAYRFRLRDRVLFHDGRRLTSRDVRYSFERLLQNEKCDSRALFSPILGADEVMEGKTAELAGFHIHSTTEFTIELESPVSFFPGLVSYPVASIVPEGARRFGRSWKEGTAGTGPFRVVRFVPGSSLELERNPSYWREGFPRSERLAFSFGVPSGEILSGFRSGRFSLAADLSPADAEDLRRDAGVAAKHQEKPGLSTYFAAFNIHRGPLSDKGLRKQLVESVDVPAIVQRTLGRLAVTAHGLIPPGLLGHDSQLSSAVRPTRAVDQQTISQGIELTATVHPMFTAEYASFAQEVSKAFYKNGVTIRPGTETIDEYLDAIKDASVDVVVGRWYADYPDADTFAYMLHTRGGFFGQLCGTPELDGLIDKARSESDPRARHAIYGEIERILAREAHVLPLFHEQVYRFARPEVEGLSVSYWSPVVAYEKLGIRNP